MSELLDLVDTATISAAGPEYRDWMDPHRWCGWCGYIHICCKCDGGGR
ncbi:MAG: hypothetical protein ABGX90_04310 [Brachybacterium sp.]